LRSNRVGTCRHDNKRGEAANKPTDPSDGEKQRVMASSRNFTYKDGPGPPPKKRYSFSPSTKKPKQQFS
jgi:hypothetical protein